MKIIAFTAKKETGKTTAVKYMMQKYPHAMHINFKDSLVEELTRLFPELLQAICDIYDKTEYDGMDPWTIEKLFRVKPPLVRSLMRNFGTELRRGEDKYYWCHAWYDKVKQANEDGVEIVFTDDLRFLSEAEMVKKWDGTIIRIMSDKPVPNDAHGSEAEMDQIVPDKTVRNFFGEVEVLYKQLDEIK